MVITIQIDEFYARITASVQILSENILTECLNLNKIRKNNSMQRKCELKSLFNIRTIRFANSTICCFLLTQKLEKRLM